MVHILVCFVRRFCCTANGIFCGCLYMAAINVELAQSGNAQAVVVLHCSLLCATKRQELCLVIACNACCACFD